MKALENLRVVRDGAADLLAGRDFADASFGLPFSASGRLYYESFLCDAYRDLSFAILDGQGPVAIVACDTGLPDRLARHGSPVEIWRRDGLDPTARRRVAREVLGELGRLAEIHRRSVALRTSARLDPLGIYAARMVDSGAPGVISSRAVLDLTQSDEQLIEGMRKGHRQQVRWGQDRLAIRVVGRDAPDRAAFDAYRRLHAEIAERVTRPMASWDVMFALIAAGQGDLVLAMLDGVLVGGTLTLDAGPTAYYASGANRRSLFDRPLSHFPLLVAAARARARGRTRYDLGETAGGTLDMTDAKQVAIGRFKSGFTATADISIVWTRAVPLT